MNESNRPQQPKHVRLCSILHTGIRSTRTRTPMVP